MSDHLIHRVRLKLDPFKPDGQADALTGLSPLTWRGKTTQIECGLYVNDVFVTSVKDKYTALSLRLFNTLDDAPILDKAATLPAADITEEEWLGKTAAKTSVTFSLTAAELDLVIDNSSENRQIFYVVVYGTVVTSSAAVVLGLAKMALMKSGPDLTPVSLTQVCKFRNGSIYLKNRTTAAWHELILDGAAGQEHIRLGAATTL